VKQEYRTASIGNLAAGTVRIFAAEVLVVPTGLLAAVFLTRQLGPELYGVFTVAAALVIWVELAATILLSRTAVKFVAESVDWASVAGYLIRVQFVIGLLAAAVIVAGAPLLATWLRLPALTMPLRLLALDIPIFALVALHKAFLIGRGAFSHAAAPIALRWSVRLVLILILVTLGLSINGAILATIAGSAAALILVRTSIRPPVWARRATNVSHVWGYAFYLFLSALMLKLFTRLDLFMVAALTTTPGAAGFYGAAQNLAIGPGLLAGSLSPLLLSTLTSLLRDGDGAQFRSMTLQSIRGCLWLLPFAAVGAAAAPEIATLIYGPVFASSGLLAAILIFAALPMLLMSVSAATLTALGQPRVTLMLAAPLVPVAAAGHLVLVPRFGAEGAAVVTAVVAWIAAAAAVRTTLRRSGTHLPRRAVLRVGVVAVMAYVIARIWEMPGAWLLVELTLLAAFIVIALVLSGEIRSQDLRAIGSSAWRRFPAQLRPVQKVQ
jgi:O-antigen/teichoic acid export membrane protein